MSGLERRQRDIIPQPDPNIFERLGDIQAYMPGLSPTERLHFTALVAAAHGLDNANRTIPVRLLRWLCRIPLPPPSDVIEKRGGKNEQVEMTPWMAYTSKHRADIPLFFDQRFNFEHPEFLPDLIANYASTGIGANKSSFNTLLHCVEDPNSKARMPFVPMPQEMGNDNYNISSFLIIHPDESVTVIPGLTANGIWTQVEQEFKSGDPNNRYSSLEELYVTDPDRKIQTVIDMAQYSSTLEINPYELWPSAHTGITINTDSADPNYQEMRFHSNHQVVDGALNTELVLSVPAALEAKYKVGMIDRQKIPVQGGSLELISNATDKKQYVGINGLPSIPYTAEFIASLSTQQRIHIDRTPPGSEPDIKDIVRRGSGTVASNYPNIFNGQKPHDYNAMQKNRIGIFHSDTIENKNVIDAINDVRSFLKREYGDHYLSTFIEKGATICAEMPLELKTAFALGMKKSFGLINDKIKAARINEGAIELAELFYGKHMDQGIGDFLEKTLSDEVRTQIHGHMTNTNITVDMMGIPEDFHPPRFGTIPPLAGEVRDQAVLATLTMKPITAKYFTQKRMVEEARRISETVVDNATFARELAEANLYPDSDDPEKAVDIRTIRYLLNNEQRIEVLAAELGYNQLLPEEVTRSVHTHTFSLETVTETPQAEAVEYAAYLYDDIQIISQLLDHVYRPWMRGVI